jgi:predicted signal transduction protein with EAL and GGDEF domain
MRVHHCAKAVKTFNRVAAFVAVLLALWAVGYLMFPFLHAYYSGPLNDVAPYNAGPRKYHHSE